MCPARRPESISQDTRPNGESPAGTGRSSRNARSFASVCLAPVPAPAMPNRIHHSSCGLLIRFGRL